MALQLQYQDGASVPLEVEGITPDQVRDQTLADIEKLPVFHGNEPGKLADFFQVSGDPTDETIVWSGDLTGVHWIGAGMQHGQIKVEGDVGRHVGSEMAGGNIEVTGNASDWVGAEMQGGMIHVAGRAGHLIGSAYRGSPQGMVGGTIRIDGDVGNEIGHSMRRGLLVVGGNCGDLIGFNMLAGTICVFGESGIRHGAGMRRGTLAFLGSERPELLPTFCYACRYQPDMLRLLLRRLGQLGMDIPETLVESEFDLFHGDLIEGGRGEVLMPADG
jgi:formylmethanofuran dehydrogenase subunit C